MGPHSFKCGSGKLAVGGACVNKLQWGRTLSSAEVRVIHRSMDGSWGTLQWGRTLSSAEVSVAIVLSERNRALQWGRTLSSAEVSYPLTN